MKLRVAALHRLVSNPVEDSETDDPPFMQVWFAAHLNYDRADFFKPKSRNQR